VKPLRRMAWQLSRAYSDLPATGLALVVGHCAGPYPAGAVIHLQMQDHFFQPGSRGARVNRSLFNLRLTQALRETGVSMFCGTELSSLDRDTNTSGLWNIRLQQPAGQSTLKARVLIDATGRPATISRKLGIKREKLDSLFAYALKFSIKRSPHHESATTNSGAVSESDVCSHIESCPYGWWYSNVIPTGQTENEISQRIFILHTDLNLPQARMAATNAGFIQLLSETRLMKSLLIAGDYEVQGRVRGAVAGSERSCSLIDTGRPAFLAIGDAAIAFDPLSSQGISSAMQSGAEAAQVTNYALTNSTLNTETQQTLFERYEKLLNQRWQRYAEEYSFYYRLEQRWTDQPFWARRQSSKHSFNRATAREAL